jgi:D-alanyl-D-alanine carboxypeptidase
LNIASVSKTITAVGVLRLLEANGLTIDDPVAPWLPATWTLGPQVDQLSFRHLLTHTSGIVSSNTNFNQTLSYDALASAIFFGANPGAPYAYLNANFALFRVIIPALWAGAGHPAANNDNAAASAFFYGMYFILEVFPLMSGAIGDEASTTPLDPNPTLYYTIGAGANGIPYGDWSGIAGGGGWHISARELAGFLAHITYSDGVLSPAARAAMDSFALGWAPLSATQGQFGQYRGHGGSIRIGGTGRVRTAIMKFPMQVEAAVLANSNIAGYSSARTLLSDAYDAAWTS